MNYLAKHIPVLLQEAVKALNIHPDGIYIDGTFGIGGHSRLILSMLNNNGKLLAIDRDPAAIKLAKKINDPRFSIFYGSFSEMLTLVKSNNLIEKINGIILDLGVSLTQINNPHRGFSFLLDGPLDMRMDNSKGKSAAQWLAKATVKDITFVLKKFGEERFAKRIAVAIVRQNKKKLITRTKELSNLITNHIPFFNKNKHPATRSFQAIRIYLNKELLELKKALLQSLTILSPGGRLAVISFHSLEDRLVKNFIQKYSNYRYQLPIGLPITEQQIYTIQKKIIKLKAINKIRPSSSEIKINYNARSALLRLAEKI